MEPMLILVRIQLILANNADNWNLNFDDEIVTDIVVSFKFKTRWLIRVRIDLCPMRRRLDVLSRLQNSQRRKKKRNPPSTRAK